MAATATDSPTRRPAWLLALLGAVVALAYSNTLSAPFVYDDTQAIVENPTIRRLWRLDHVLGPQSQGGLTVSGRPVLNLSLAINYALSGTNPWSYHVFNILIHIGASLLLFGIVHRTVRRWHLGVPGCGKTSDAGGKRRVERDGALLAVAVAALWALHPLQTQAVTYTVQRAESLMGFFYLLTLYAFIRGVDLPRTNETKRSRQRWCTVSIAACVLGMGTKEVMVTAPLLVLLYDRTFLGGSFRAVWRERRGLHLALAATWIVAALLVWSTGGNRGGTVGAGVGVPLWAYPLTQLQALARYLALSVWPAPLVFEYGTFWVERAREVLPYAAVVLPLLAATVVALWRAPVAGFLGAWFFLILAPSSLAPGTIQMIVEHRMYLPLAAVLTLLVAGAYRCSARGTLAGAGLLAAGLALLTYSRNNDYRSHLTLWGDTVAKRPHNPRAHEGMAEAYAALGQTDAAVRQFAEVVRLKPDESTYHYNLALAAAKAGQLDTAIRHYQLSLKLTPSEPRTHNNLAIALGQAGQTEAALAHYREAERLAPRDPQYPFNHGIALFRSGRTAEAIGRYETAIRLQPDHADAHFNLGTALATSGQMERGLEHYATAVRIAPRDAEMRSTYGGALLVSNQPRDALTQFDAALQADPRHVAARFGRANALARLSRLEDAIAAYLALLRDEPDHANAHFKLANALIDLDRVTDAARHYERTVQLSPNDAEAHHNLGIAYARMERWPDARREFETALRLKPDYADARKHLDQLRTVIGR